MAEPVEPGQAVVVLEAEVLEAGAEAGEVAGAALEPLRHHALELRELPRHLLLPEAEQLLLHLPLQPLQLLPHHALQLAEGHLVGLLDVRTGGLVVGDVQLQDGLLAHRAVAEDHGDFLAGGAAVVVGRVEADEEVGTAGTLDEELAVDLRTGELPVVLGGQRLEEDALLGAVADLPVRPPLPRPALAHPPLPDCRQLTRGHDILVVPPVLLLQPLQFELGPAGAVRLFRPEGALVLVR